MVIVLTEKVLEALAAEEVVENLITAQKAVEVDMGQIIMDLVALVRKQALTESVLSHM